MKATGIVRKIDDLGRIVIPKETRRTLHIRETDLLEIYMSDSGEIVLKKYSPLTELGILAEQYCDALHRISGYPVLVCDCEHIVAVSGLSKNEMIGRGISPELEESVRKRKSFSSGPQNRDRIKPVKGTERIAVAGTAIVGLSGDVYGAVVLLANDGADADADTPLALVNMTAALLGMQMGNSV